MPSHFKTFGPFELGAASEPRETKELRQFWLSIEGERKGLQDAIGVYVLAVGSARTRRPVYVGKAEHGFRARLKPNHDAFRKAAHKYKDEALSLILIARATNKRGDFVRKRKENESQRSVNDLEILLIRECLSRGIELLNSAGVKYFEEFVVPGYLHDEKEPATQGAKCLERMLPRNSKVAKSSNKLND